MLSPNRLTLILLVGLFLRSLVASGYMVDSQPADGGLFTITLCDGPGGINQLPEPDPHEHHHQGGHDNHDNSHDDHTAALQEHGFSACSFWSASGQLLASTNNLPEFTVLSHEQYEPTAPPAFVRNSVVATRFARAPPLLA